MISDFEGLKTKEIFLHRPKPKIVHLMGTKNIFNLDNNNKKGVEHILPIFCTKQKSLLI